MSKLITAETHGEDEIMVKLPRHRTTVVVSRDEASDLSYALDEALTPEPKVNPGPWDFPEAVHVETVSPPPFHIGQVITLPTPNDFEGEELGPKPVSPSESPQGSVVYIVGDDTKTKYGVNHGTEAVVADSTSAPYLRHGDYAVRLTAPMHGGKVLVVPASDLDVGPYVRFEDGAVIRWHTKPTGAIADKTYIVHKDSLSFVSGRGSVLRSFVDRELATTQYAYRVSQS